MADERRHREDFRLQQHAQPHPALQQQQQRPGDDRELEQLEQLETLDSDDEPDTGRIIFHLDVDCFYAQVSCPGTAGRRARPSRCSPGRTRLRACTLLQVEEARNPALRDAPLGVTQKYLVVTCK
jgi:hypothetical protein